MISEILQIGAGGSVGLMLYPYLFHGMTSREDFWPVLKRNVKLYISVLKDPSKHYPYGP